MPAVSDAGLPHTWRPMGSRMVGIVLVVCLYGMCVFTWFAFDTETRQKFTVFEKGTMAFFGILILVLVHALIRSRVQATAERLVVVNGYKRREFAWEQVVAARMPPGAPWVTLDLADGTTVPAMGIQASDGGRARAALRDLRALIDQPRAD